MKHFSAILILVTFTACTLNPKRHVSGGESVSFPSNAHKAKEVLFFGNWGTSTAVKNFVQTLDKINNAVPESEKVKVRIFAELPSNYDTGEIPAPEDLTKELDLTHLGFTYKSRDLAQSNKHIIFYVDTDSKLGPSLWLQDYGQLYYEGDSPTFLDLNYGTLENTSELHRYIRSPIGLKGGINSDFKGKRSEETINTTLEGGDIEVLPNGKVLVGNVIHPELESFLKDDLGREVIKVPADFMATGHVDEVFSIVPSPKEQSNGCGYALVYIDPLYGLRLAMDRELKHQQTDNRQDYIKAISYFTDGDGEKLIHRDSFSTIPAKFKGTKPLAVTEEPWGVSPNYHQWYVYKTLDIHNKVQEGIKTIKAAVANSCADLKTVGLPVIFSDYAAGESTLFTEKVEQANGPKELSDAFKEAPVNMHFSPINMIVLNKNLMLPVVQDSSPSNWSEEFSKSFEATYQWIIPLRLKTLGIEESNVHFVNSNAFIANGGSLHCGSLTVREKDQTVY